MRDQLKCSRCRTKKLKCMPRDRPAYQKCDNCQKHDDAPCGPNYKKKDDPACSESPNEEIPHEEDSIEDAEGQPRVPNLQRSATCHDTVYINQSNANEPVLVSEESSGKRKRNYASDKDSGELQKDADLKLGNLNSMGRSHGFASQLYPVSCKDQNNPAKYNKQPEDDVKAMSTEFHSLFSEICHSGLQLYERGLSIDACIIFMKLMNALERYPRLVDDRKIGAMRKIANFHKEMGDQDEYERVLDKAAKVHGASIYQENPCPPLATSLVETSNRAKYDLHKLWDKEYMSDGRTSLAIPPIQRSAQHRNAGVAASSLAHPNSIAQSPPALFNQESLHIAASLGNEEILKVLLKAGAQVDDPDIHRHTALFLAAAKGHDGCCVELIKWRADVNRRNIHGTTILEAAAGAGHLNIVQHLVTAGANVNPDLLCCASSPLQAAIEKPTNFREVALYLIGKGGDVKIQRKDGKNALDLAKKRCGFLARIIGQKQQPGTHEVFEPLQTFYFDQRDLEFGPSLP